MTCFGENTARKKVGKQERCLYTNLGAKHNFYTVLSQLKRNSSKEPRRACQADIQRNINALKSENASDSPEALGSLSSTTAEWLAVQGSLWRTDLQVPGTRCSHEPGKL